VLLFFKQGIVGVLFHSVLIQRIRRKFPDCGPICSRHVRLIAELVVQVLHSVSLFVWDHIVFNAPVTELVYVLVLEAKF
jgi:hypothetical protein